MKTFDLTIDRVEVGSNPLDRGVSRRLFRVLTTVKLAEHPIGILGSEGDGMEKRLDLSGHVFLADIFLRTRPALLRAATIDVTLLAFIRDHAPALAAAEESLVEVAFRGLRLRAALLLHDLLNAIEELLRDERLMLALEDLALVQDEPAVDRVPEKAMDVAFGEPAAPDAREPGIRHLLVDLGQRVVAGCEHLEGHLDDGPAFGIDDNGLGVALIEIPDGGIRWPEAVPDLLANPSLDVLGEIIHVVLAHREQHAQGELARGTILKRRVDELEVLDDARVEVVDDASAVEGVASKAIRMPGEDSLRLAFLHAAEHLIEDRAPGKLRRPLLNQDVGNVDALLTGKLPRFGVLVANTASLTRRVVCRLSQIHEVFDGCVGHGFVREWLRCAIL